jgi:hypothetical protein
MKKRSLRVKEWRGRKRAQGLRLLSLWLDTATYGRLQAMAQREQVSPAAIVTHTTWKVIEEDRGIVEDKGVK